MLCQDCASLHPYRFYERASSVNGKAGVDFVPLPPFVLKASATALAESTQQCKLCRIVSLMYDVCVKNDEYFTGERREGAITVTADRDNSPGQADLRLLSLAFYCTSYYFGSSIVAADENDPAALSHDVVRKALAPRNLEGVPLQFDFLRNWLTNCRKSHTDKACRYSGSSSDCYIPTRLLDLESEHPRLVLRDEAVSSGYVALSHCWGKVSTIRTTLATFEAHRRAIRLEDTPRSFQHAFLVTRQLGLRYFWIDSLCIMQDCQDDWRQEAASMGDVYRNATVTIAASAAKDSEQGLFFPTDWFDEVVRIPYERKSNDSTGTLDGAANLLIQQALGSSSDLPLNQRAWVLQEEILSQRIIYCTRRQLHWSCRSIKFSEDNGPTESIGWGSETPFQFKKNTKTLSDVILEGQSATLLEPTIEHAFAWYKAVENFTNRAITVPSDRLPALAGLAQALQYREPAAKIYAAGIWAGQFLHIGLLWQRDSFGEALKDYRAPSWSWAALEGPVNYGHKPRIGVASASALNDQLNDHQGHPTRTLYMSRRCAILEARIVTQGEYLTSPIVYGVLDARCLLKEAIMTCHNPGCYIHCAENPILTVPCRADEDWTGADRHVHCALISQNVKEKVSFVLILEERENLRYGSFARIGMAEIYNARSNWFPFPCPTQESVAEGGSEQYVKNLESHQNWKRVQIV